MRTVLSSLFIVFILTASFTFGQNTYDFLNVDMSARAASLGGSFVTNNDDVDVLFYNPAGMSFLEKNPVSFSFVKKKHILQHCCGLRRCQTPRLFR